MLFMRYVIMAYLSRHYDTDYVYGFKLFACILSELVSSVEVWDGNSTTEKILGW